MCSSWWQVESAFRVAGPGLEGGQVAVLRSYVASSLHVVNATYSCERGGRITQLQYFLQLSLRTSISPQYRRHPAETLLGRDLKHDFDALPRRSSMANFYLPLSPRTHDQVPGCLLCSPITWTNARRAPAAARCKLPEHPKAHRLGGRLAHDLKKGRLYEHRHHRSIWPTRSFDRRTGPGSHAGF